MASGEACVLGACCPLGIAAQVPGTDGRPGFASTGFPVSFAALVCSCKAAGWERGRRDRGEPGLLTWAQGPEQSPSLAPWMLGGCWGVLGRAEGGIMEGRMQPAPSVPGSLIWCSVARKTELGAGGLRGPGAGIAPGAGRALGTAGSAGSGMGRAAEHLLLLKAWPRPRAISSWRRCSHTL